MNIWVVSNLAMGKVINTYVIFHMQICSINSKMKLLNQREHALGILLNAKVPSKGVVAIYTPNSKV